MVPIYNAYDHVSRLLESIKRTTPGYPVDWVLMNDASPDERISTLLQEFAASYDGPCRVVNSAENRGFTKTCNAAMDEDAGSDVILLNSDTIVYDGWVRRLLEAAYEDPAIGTATPLSNNASCYSMFEHVTASNRINDMLMKAERSSLPIPVGVGFCLYVKREVLDRVGKFDPVFGRGYGEETDLCLRACAAGYRHVLATRVFVYHAGSASMIAANVVREGETTIAEHERIINQRYPGYVASVHEFIASRVIEKLGHELGKQYLVHESGRRPSIAIVSHDDVFAPVIGGTTYHIQDLMRDLEQDFLFYVISPEADKIRITGYADGVVESSIPTTDNYASVLDELSPSLVHIHHLMNFPHAFFNALVKWPGQKIFTIHDYYGVCPQYHLMNYEQTYCGVPEAHECDRCAQKLFGTGYSTIAEQRREFQRLVDSTAVLLAPSHAALSVFRKAISVPDEKTTVIPHPLVSYAYDPRTKHTFSPPSVTSPSTPVAVDAAHTSQPGESSLDDSVVTTSARDQDQLIKEARLRVAFIGYYSPHKGTALLQEIITECSKDPIAFIALGDIAYRVGASENVVSTGRYNREEITDLIQRYSVDVVVVTSLWPETFCYTLSEAWMAGVPVVVGPLGAQAERVAETGAGVIVGDFRVQSFVATLRNLMNDKDNLCRLKQAAAAVSQRQNYDEYRDLYSQYISHAPISTRYFAQSVEEIVRAPTLDASQIPLIAKLVAVRKRVFPVGSVREKGYLWLHHRLLPQRVARSYVRGTLSQA